MKPPYEYTDKLYRNYAKLIVRLFNSLNRELQSLNFDEMNVSSGYQTVTEKVTRVYKKLYDELLEILILMFIEGFKASSTTFVSAEGDNITYYTGKKDGFRVNQTLNARDYVIWYLSEDNIVTHYIFDREYQRKVDRTAEEIMSSQSRTELKKATEKAMRYWNTQAKQGGDNITIHGFKEGLEKSGIKKVRWVTQEDTRVCEDCEKNNGKIFDIKKIKIPLHYNCRCYFISVK